MLLPRKDDMDKEELEQVVSELHTINEALKVTYERKNYLESVLIQAMQSDNATRLDSSNFVTDLKTDRQYDPNRFRAEFGETMNAEELESFIVPEHTVEKVVAERVNGNKAKSLWKQGSEITEDKHKTKTRKRKTYIGKEKNYGKCNYISIQSSTR